MTRIFFFLFGFLLLAVKGWAECVEGTYTQSSPFNPSLSGVCDANLWASACSLVDCPSEFTLGGYTYKNPTSVKKIRGGTYQNTITCPGSATSCQLYSPVGCGYTYNCTLICTYTQKCDAKIDSCIELRTECESAGGTFTGTTVSDNGQSCCRGSCNVCGSNAMKKLFDAKKRVCCENGMAPPDEGQTCHTVSLPTSGCGMVWSTYGDFTSGGWSCADPSSSWEAGARYATCNDDPNGSSSSGVGSSSGGGSSGQYGDCQECPWLDSILDTLTAQKQQVDDIYACLVIPGMCGQQQQDSLEIPEWIREKMDVVIGWDSTTTHNTKSIDSVVKKLSDFMPSILQSDTITREEIKESLRSLDTSVRSINDTTAHYLTHVANVIGASENELSAHLDSIIKHIPDSVLDSILKYQKYSFDSFDSLGNGFAKIDDLTDSAIKYFKEGYRFDSIYNTQYRDSLGVIHTAISDIGSNIGYGLGYGDTASSTLRKDLNGIKDGLDDLNGKFDAAVVDTGSVGFGSSWVSDGERMGDSIGRAVGWIGGLDGVDLDSIFRAGGFDSLAVDSVSASVDDSLSFIADSLNNILVAQNDSIKRGLPDSLSVWADSLVSYSPFASFDSLIFGQLGAKIPNSNQCPEDCQKWTINLPRFGLFAFEVDYGLCLGRAPLGGMNALSFIRLLLRIVVVWSCIWIVFNALTRRKD